MVEDTMEYDLEEHEHVSESETVSQQDPEDMPLLSKHDILAVDDRPTEIVAVPEWGGAVRIQALSAWDQSEYQSRMVKIKSDAKGKVETSIDQRGADVLLVAFAVIDADGNRMFDGEELRGRSYRAIKRIADRARVLSGMDIDLEEAEGN